MSHACIKGRFEAPFKVSEKRRMAFKEDQGTLTHREEKVIMERKFHKKGVKNILMNILKIRG